MANAGKLADTAVEPDGPERRFMLSPMILGRLIQALGIKAGDRALDVACGPGIVACAAAAATPARDTSEQ